MDSQRRILPRPAAAAGGLESVASREVTGSSFLARFRGRRDAGEQSWAVTEEADADTERAASASI